ncbi:hypothetical protein DFJ73DRAFT_776085 [Zopfochytrium polystomum]|nr:hypothetical protein DFJ73DRAFT_776085 [Zopfochytrium polystomum]
MIAAGSSLARIAVAALRRPAVATARSSSILPPAANVPAAAAAAATFTSVARRTIFHNSNRQHPLARHYATETGSRTPAPPPPSSSSPSSPQSSSSSTAEPATSPDIEWKADKAADWFLQAEALIEKGESVFYVPSADGFYNVGYCLYLSEQLEDAVQAWERAIELDPNHVSAHVNLANVLALHLKKPERAVDHYREAVRLNPNDGEVQYNLGVVLDLLGRLEEAVQTYEAAEKLGVEQAQKNLRNARAKLLKKMMDAA